MRRRESLVFLSLRKAIKGGGVEYSFGIGVIAKKVEIVVDYFLDSVIQ